MADRGFILVFQCKKCNTILGDTSSSIGDITSLSLTCMSAKVRTQKSAVYCSVCKEIVATKENDCVYKLDSSKIHSTSVGDSNQRLSQLEAQVKEQDARIIQLGLQVIMNKTEAITLKYAMEHNHPSFSLQQFKDDLNS